jgi:hypothetical protein
MKLQINGKPRETIYIYIFSFEDVTWALVKGKDKALLFGWWAHTHVKGGAMY